MGVEDNIEVVRRVPETLTARDWVAFQSLFADDLEWTIGATGRVINGPAELVDGYRAFTTAFPDVSVVSVNLLGRGDLVAHEWTARGTHNGPLQRADGRESRPTGRSFERSGVGMVELRDGKIIRYRDYYDRQTMTEQLGLD
jgi:steroid delta-isomerase-like uncharacterized protein